MTKLLVSVRNAAEALVAADAGAHLIDVKEPDRGALGAADFETVAAVVAAVDHRVPTSAALGELVDFSSDQVSLPRGLRFAKIGLAGCGRRANWKETWRAAVESFPAETARIAVAYADWSLADAPDPRQVLDWAQAVGCRGILLDTFDKRRGRLFDYYSSANLRSWINSTRAAGLLAVVAGGLGLNDVGAVVQHAPDYLGVRGAACLEGRTGSIDADRVRKLVDAVAGSRHAAALPAAAR